MVYIFLLFVTQVWAIDSVSSIVEQAQAHALKKNRQEACTLLQQALRNASGPKARTKLTESLMGISKVFFTDKGQKAYEAGQSLMWENSELAMTQFRAAQALENGNVLVLGSVARVQLIKQDCEGAYATTLEAQKLNPVDVELALLEVQALSCSQRYEQMRERARTITPVDKWHAGLLQYVLAVDMLQQGAARKSYDVALKLTEDQPDFPEGHLLLSKASAPLNKDVEPALQKYVALCKALTTRERKRYALEPRLCLNLKEAENELLKKNSEL